jgi:hypothetical protein
MPILASNDLVDESVVDCFFRAQEEVSIRVFPQFRDRLARNLRKNIQDLTLHKKNFAGGDIDVRGLPT